MKGLLRLRFGGIPRIPSDGGNGQKEA
jgi:hypothetical protein